MAISFKKKSGTACAGMLMLLLAWHSLAFSQHVQLQKNYATPAGEPHGDRDGALWAWRSGDGLSISSSNASRETRILGTFLRHQVNATGTVILSLEQSGGAEYARGDKAGLQLRRHSRDGTLLGTHAVARHADDPLPQFVMTDNGAHVIVLEPGVARATFISSSGAAPEQSYLFENAPYRNERPVFLAASASRFFVLSQALPATEAEAFPPVLVCFSFEGKEQWRRELPVGTAGNLALSPSGKRLLASRYRVEAGTQNVHATWHAFDVEGRVIATGMGMFRAAAFSFDEEQIVLMERRELRGLSLLTGNPAWQFALTAREEMFVALAAASRTESYFALIAAGRFKENRFVYEEARLAELDDTGSLKTALPVSHTLIKPALTISADQQTLWLAAEGLLQQYKIAEEPQRQRKE